MSNNAGLSFKQNLFTSFADNCLKPTALWLLGVITAVSIAFILAPSFHSDTRPLNVGDISRSDIKAPADFSVEDKTTTTKRREEALAQLLSIYDFDTDMGKVIDKINFLFAQIAKNNYQDKAEEAAQAPDIPRAEPISPPKAAGKENVAAPAKPKELSLEERWKLVVHKNSLPISFKTFQTLQNPLFNQLIKEKAVTLATRAMENGIVGNKELLLREKEKGIIKRNLKTKSQKVIKDISIFWDMEEAKQAIDRLAAQTFSSDQLTLNAAIEIAHLAIQPNLFFNKSATEESKQELLKSVKPVYFQTKKGEMIVREGERVREDQAVKLAALRTRSHQSTPIIFLSGVTVLILLLLYLMFVYLKKFRTQIVENPNQVYLLAVILIITSLISRLFIFLSNALSAFTPQINVSAYSYAIPFALGGMLVTVLIDAQFGVIFSMLVGILAAIQMNNDFIFFLLAAVGGIGAVYGVSHAKQRTTLLTAGLVVGLVNLGVIIPAYFITEKPFAPELLYGCLGGLAGGLLVSIIASALIPALETIFKVTTDIKLLEISDMNQPLLKRLALEAPGTYQHSIVVGSLAEAAAEAIGANPLLTRISAYYHDIGKVSKAEYFVENQPNKENKHAKLSPSMSSLIINSHVKEGIDLARQYKLPPLIIDAIQQHHGTSLMQFFYQKAKQRENADVQIIKETDFSYSGPKPQTKECGILMMADVLEATSRSLNNPNPQKLEETVNRTIHDIYNMGQLDECDLTLRNLNQIATAFVRILTSVYHARIEYPDFENVKKKERSWISKSEISKIAKK